MSYVDRYRASRAAAASAWGWQRLASGSEPNMNTQFALELIQTWNAFGDEGADKLSVVIGDTRVGRSYGYEQVDAARWRLALMGPGIAVDMDPATGLLNAPGQLWKLIFAVASSIDAVALEPSKTETDLAVIAGTVKDTAVGAAELALQGVKGVASALEGPLVIAAIVIGLYLVNK